MATQTDPVYDTTIQIRIKKVPKLKPNPNEHFELVKDIKLPQLTDNQLVIETEYLSVDPYQRGRMRLWYDKNPTKQMYSYTVAKVLKSTDNKYKAGDYIYGVFPWATRNIIDSKKVMSTVPPNLTDYNPKLDKNYIPNLDDDNKDGNYNVVDNDDQKNTNQFDVSSINQIPHSYYVGAYGMPGITAYYGLIIRGKIKKGENLLISGAAGAVGSIVGQIAKKVFGCHVIGICGTQNKMKWITEELGFDGAINYKTVGNNYKKAQAVLKSKFPNGIDCYFDNVGGIFTEAAWDLLNVKARVLVCGQISTYNDDRNNPRLIRPMLHKLIYKEIDIKGLIQNSFTNHKQFYYCMGKWITTGKIKVKETVIDGFQNAPKAFVGLFTGQNIGKMVVKCS